MKRRAALRLTAAAAAAPLVPRPAFARPADVRLRPGDPRWPAGAAWQGLARRLRGRLVALHSPFDTCRSAPKGAQCAALFENVRNPYYIGDDPALTQTLGWVDAWTSRTSAYAVEARDASDVAAAVTFARENDLRLVVKGGGHSYLGTSNAPDSLLIWTRRMNDIVVESDAVTLGAGCIWVHAYDAVTTKAGRYVQGGGCTTVGVAGLVASGGFGSFSKHYGTAASSLLEAEVVTADGKVRIASASTNADLFWALKGGGGGTFGVVTKIKLRLHDLPEFFGAAAMKIRASSDDAFARLIARIVDFYAENLFNDHWGEQIHIGSDNTLEVSMVSQGLDQAAVQAVWKPFLDWIAQNSSDYSFVSKPILAVAPARNWWNAQYIEQNYPFAIVQNKLPGSAPSEFWWRGDGSQVGQVLYAYESLWLPASLLDGENRQHLADTFFQASRSWDFELHFNKGLAGAPAGAIAASRDTATNPAVASAFALVIAGDGQGPAYPGVRGHEPDAAAARKSALSVRQCMDGLRSLTPHPGSYVSESDFFARDWRHSYWGANYARLAAVKKKYDPDGLFYVHHGVGSEAWSSDGFTRLR
ncbi:MAG TPA: FAD-binding oxidoreductase [Candidatus Baltobacteraceae bacterium]|jgi:FAD/FMN-containing dehydrogenase